MVSALNASFQANASGPPRAIIRIRENTTIGEAVPRLFLLANRSTGEWRAHLINKYISRAGLSWNYRDGKAPIKCLCTPCTPHNRIVGDNYFKNNGGDELKHPHRVKWTGYEPVSNGSFCFWEWGRLMAVVRSVWCSFAKRGKCLRRLFANGKIRGFNLTKWDLP